MNKSTFSLDTPHSLNGYVLAVVGFGLCAVGSYSEIGLLAVPLTVGVALSWLVLPTWYAFALGEIGFVAAAQSPTVPSIALVNAGLGCVLCSTWSSWGGDRLLGVRIGSGAVVIALLLWAVHRLYSDVWITAGVFGITGTCVFYLLHRYQQVEMGVTEGQHE